MLDDFTISDNIWLKIETLINYLDPSSNTGRVRLNRRGIADAIYYRTKTGVQWKALDRFRDIWGASYKTINRVYNKWSSLGVFEEYHRISLVNYDESIGLCSASIIDSGISISMRISYESPSRRRLYRKKSIRYGKMWY